MLYSYCVLPDRSMRREWLVDDPEGPPLTLAPFAETSCWLEAVVPEDRATMLARSRRLLAGERSLDQVRVVTAEGLREGLNLLGVPISKDGRVERIIGSASALASGRIPGAAEEAAGIAQANQIAALQAQIKAREEQLRQAFEDVARTSEIVKRYRVMFREHAHRSKNNVQLAASLVRLIKRNARGLSRDELDAIDRLGAMAKTDSLLFQGDDEQFEAAGPYFCKIAEHTVRFHGGDQVGLDCQYEPLMLCGLELRSLGMVLHELVSNAITHAFPSGAGHIMVRLARHGKDKAELSVIDDGIGIALENTMRPAHGTGIIAELVRQLEGELSITPLNSKGTLARVVFTPRAERSLRTSGQLSDAVSR